MKIMIQLQDLKMIQPQELKVSLIVSTAKYVFFFLLLFLIWGGFFLVDFLVWGFFAIFFLITSQL